MFVFISRTFIAVMAFVGCSALTLSNLLNAIPLKCVSMNNQESKVGLAMANIKSNEPLFYPYRRGGLYWVKIYRCARTLEST